MSQAGAIDVLGRRLERLEGRLEAFASTIEGIGYEVVDRIAKFRAPVEEKEEEWIAPELAKVMAPVVSLRTTLFELNTRLRNFGDAFSGIVREAEWARKEGRLRDNSFEVILMAWGDCKRGSYFKLLTNAPLAKAVPPSLEEHFFALEEGARNLDTAINNDNRGALLHAVENFEYHLRSFQESVIAHLKRRAGDD